ncbi:Ig-like domain-containing protein [Geomobilimonas luticola]|uniref:6-bladed beta-propeller n=1 Tax=Geomobilimonas luticola TaxID=1114878 RepID=A0ABS5SA84_9BACT|nr:Ig-like domain-containing protein [Geomobilimonas luticola]MBT0652288.1 6-bladed beta-propeller [Geomobilimonas luticola]
MLTRLYTMLVIAVIMPAVLVISLTSTSSAATVPVVTVLSPVTRNVSSPVRIVLDQQGNYYVTDPRAGGVSKFNTYGRLMKSIPTPLPPLGVALNDQGNLVVTQGSYVVVLDQNGAELGRLGSGAGQFKKANGIAIDGNGYIYVVDSLDDNVKVFTGDGQYVKAIGSTGTAVGQFTMPTAIAYEKKANQIVVTDTLNGRVQFFNASTHVAEKSIGKLGANALQFSSPQGISFEYDATGTASRMYVVDTFQSTVQVIDPAGAGTFLAFISSFGTANGQLVVPGDVAYDPLNKRLIVTNGYGYLTMFGIDGGTNPAKTTPPVLAIDPVAANVSTSNITISGTVEASSTVAVATGSTAVASAVAYTSATTWTCDITGLLPGSNVITVTATDGAGNTASQTATVVYTLPAPSLTLNAGLPTLVRDASLTMSGSVEADATVTVSNTTTGTTEAATIAGTAWSYTATLAAGVNNITVTAQKPGSSPAVISTSVTLDAVAPVLAVSALPTGSYTSTQTQNISGTVSDANLDSVTVNGQPVVVTNGTFSTSVTLVTGANTVNVAASDLLGNTSSDTRTIYFDAATPVIIVASPADNAMTNATTLTVSGSVDKAATVTVAGKAAKVDGSNNWTANLELLAGQNTITITAVDLYGNTSTLKRTVTLDAANPVLAITSPSQDLTTKKPNVVLAGTVSDSSEVALSSSVNGVITPLVAVAGTYSFNVDFTAEGTYPVQVIATDAAGNSTTTTRTITYDKTPPKLTVNKSSAYQPARLSGTVEPDATVQVKEGEVVLATAAISDAAWSVDLGTATYDPAALRIFAYDAAGNSTALGLTYQFPDGDVDGNGTVTMADALTSIRLVVNNGTPTAAQLAHGDIGPLVNGKPNPNGTIDLVDALLILRKAVGLKSWDLP